MTLWFVFCNCNYNSYSSYSYIRAMRERLLEVWRVGEELSDQLLALRNGFKRFEDDSKGILSDADSKKDLGRK